MSVQVQLPPVLRHAMQGARSLDAAGDTVAAVLNNLGNRYPALALHLFDERGEIRHNIVCVHQGTVVRAREMQSRRLQAGDELLLANSLAGG